MKYMVPFYMLSIASVLSIDTTLIATPNKKVPAVKFTREELAIKAERYSKFFSNGRAALIRGFKTEQEKENARENMQQGLDGLNEFKAIPGITKQTNMTERNLHDEERVFKGYLADIKKAPVMGSTQKTKKKRST